MKRIPIIVGIDPGTTLGYAVIDTERKLVSKGSSKGTGLSDLIKIISEEGIVVAVGCDKKNVPSFVNKFSSQLGARTISPKNDLLVEEKKQLVGDIASSNTHEFDAIASAFLAFSSLRPLIRKIRLFVFNNNKQKIASEIYSYVIKKGISIRAAVEIIESPEKEETKTFKKVIEQKGISKKEYVRLYEKFAESEFLLNHYKKKARTLEKEVKTIKKSRPVKKDEAKENKKITYLRNQIKNILTEKRKIDQEKNDSLQKLEALKSVILKREDFVIAKRIASLGRNFISEAKEKNLDYNDIIYVDDPTNVVQESINVLDDLNLIIVSEKMFPNPLKNKGILLIDAKKTKIKSFGDLVFVEKKIIDEQKKKQDLLGDIIKEYKQSRNLS